MLPERFAQRQTAPDNLESTSRSLRVGTGRAIAHHGELLQGVFEGDDARLHRGLVTLPLASMASLVTFWPREGKGIRTRPVGRSKAARAARLALDYLGLPNAAGDLTLESGIPVGFGYGSSTADVTAAIRAVAAAAGTILRRSTVAGIAVAAEGASDAIAFGEQVVLFAQREGRVLEDFGGEYPPLVVIGWGSGDATPMDTLQMKRARYTAAEIERLRTLRGLMSRAIRRQDAVLLGRIATESARISQRHLFKPGFDLSLTLASEFGGCGVQVSHSGSLIGVLFDAREHDVLSRANALARRLPSSAAVQLFSVGAEGVFLP